jgi:hypothetical protein
MTSFSKKRALFSIVLLGLFFVLLLSSCMFLPYEEVRIYNPTSEPVLIRCYSFMDGVELTIPAYGYVVKRIPSFSSSITLYEEGRYFCNASETVYDLDRSIMLTPNCAYIKLTNYTGATISTASIARKYFIYDRYMNFDGSTIVPYAEKWLRIDQSDYFYAQQVLFTIGATTYMTTSSYSTPKMGTTLSITLR